MTDNLKRNVCPQKAIPYFLVKRFVGLYAILFCYRISSEFVYMRTMNSIMR